MENYRLNSFGFNSSQIELYLIKRNEMFGKLLEAKKQAEEIKSKLSGLKVTGMDGLGRVMIRMDGNKKIDAVKLDEQMLKPERKTELEECIMAAMEDAMQQADNVSQAEMKHLLGNLPGLGSILK